MLQNTQPFSAEGRPDSFIDIDGVHEQHFAKCSHRNSYEAITISSWLSASEGATELTGHH